MSGDDDLNLGPFLEEGVDQPSVSAVVMRSVTKTLGDTYDGKKFKISPSENTDSLRVILAAVSALPQGPLSFGAKAAVKSILEKLHEAIAKSLEQGGAVSGGPGLGQGIDGGAIVPGSSRTTNCTAV